MVEIPYDVLHGGAILQQMQSEPRSRNRCGRMKLRFTEAAENRIATRSGFSVIAFFAFVLMLAARCRNATNRQAKPRRSWRARW